MIVTLSSSAVAGSHLPLKLPTLTFMVGGDPAGNNDLAKAIIARDSDCETMLLAQPAIDATSIALGGNYSLTTSLMAEKATPDQMEWLRKMTDLLAPILSERLADMIGEDLGTYFCSRIIILDATYPLVLEMQKHFRTEDMCVVQLGPLQSPPSGLSLWKHVWVPHSATAERMSMLEREFGLNEVPEED